MFSGLGEFPLCSSQAGGSTFPALVAEFSASLAADHPPWHLHKTELAALDLACTSLAPGDPFGRELPDGGLHAVPHVQWFAEYGCALIAHEKRVGVIDLRLVGLDGWEFQILSDATARHHCSQAGMNAATQLSVPDLTPDTAEYDEWMELDSVGRYEKFLRLAMQLLAAAKSRKGDKRSGVSNEQGNQKTPAMIQAILRDAVEGLKAEEEPDEGSTPPRGGFTDVGMHTGGSARNTTWPLVRAVLQVLLESQDQHMLYRRAMAQFQLWLTERLVASTSPDDATGDRISTIMQMLTAAVAEAEALADEQCPDAELFQTRCAAVR